MIRSDAGLFVIIVPGQRGEISRLVVCAPSRVNDPELAAVLPGWGQPLTFDAENAAGQVGHFFEITDTETWDAPLIDLATAGDVRRYLRGRGLTEDAAGRAAELVPVPLRLTKRGALIWAASRSTDRPVSRAGRGRPGTSAVTGGFAAVGHAMT
jgi:hypothetical protein